MNTLRSVYDGATESIALELTAAESLSTADRLAFTSIVQLTPGASTAARLVRQLASYHELSPPTDLAPGETWTIADLDLSHNPNHANDGPVRAFLVRPDGTIDDVTVEPMRRGDHDRRSDGVSDHRHERADDRSHGVPSLIPYPVELKIEELGGQGVTTVSFGSGPEGARAAWTAIAALAQRTTTDSRLVDQGDVIVSATLDAALEPEEYWLSLDGRQIAVTAAGAAGFRHAFVTLARWLVDGLPSRASIVDRPRYRFRGLHVDLARQWFEPDVVERLIDLAAWRKLSHVHLHLTDDEAWRVPVVAIPELGTIGGVRGHDLALPPMLGSGPEPTGRAYTCDEIGRWVARADELGIVLVPEVDLPAHVHAALTARPELRDPDDSSGARSVQFFSDNVLVPGHPETMSFVESVIDAVADLFPTSPYIHIGGDEVPHGAWSRSPLAATFMRDRGLSSVRDVEAEFHRDVVRLIGERTGRLVAAWQEAGESGGVVPGDGYVVGWRTVEASRDLATQGYDVVVSPGQAYYLDMAVDDHWDTPGASWAGATSLERVCAFDPEEGWSAEEREHLLGVQACLWTEHVHDEPTLLRFLLPRLDAIAERAWTGRIEGGWRSLANRSGSDR